MLIYASADLAGSSIALVLSPVFTRLFTPEQYGAQAALGAVWAFAGIAQFGGMDSAYPMFRAKIADEGERRRLVATATMVAIVAAASVTCVFGAVAMATGWLTNFAGVRRGEVACYVLTLVPGALMAWFLYILRFDRRAAAFARVSLLGRVAAGLLLIPVLVMTPQHDRMAVAFLVGAIITGCAAAMGGRETRRAGWALWSRELFDPDRAKEMLRYGLFLIPASGLYAASTVLDRLLVTWFSGPQETATLALALRLGAVATMLRTWFALVWDPQLIQWIASAPRESLYHHLQDALGLISRVALILVCFAAIWSEPVVTLLYPQAYWPAVALIPWIVFGVALSALSLVAVATITIAQKPQLCLPVYGSGLIANFGIGCWAVPAYGAIGAVAGAVAGEACILSAWFLIGTRIFRNLPLRWLGALAIVLAGGTFVALYRPGALWAGFPIGERLLVSAAVLLAAGVPVARRLWQARHALFPHQVAR